MQSMPGVQGVASGRTLSLGALVLFGAGFALYQLTSLVLGPVSSRQLDLSLTIPPLEVRDPSETLAPRAAVVLGTHETPAASGRGAARIASSRRAVSTPAPRIASQAVPTVPPKPQPTVAPKAEPVAVAKPEPDWDASNHHDDH
jgi:hypothetical protein